MSELISLRTARSKTWDLGGGKKRVEITQHSQHYFEAGEWRDINTNWEFEAGFGFKILRAAYHLRQLEDRPTLRFGFSEGVYVDYQLPSRMASFINAQGYYDIPIIDTRVQYTAVPDGLKMEIIESRRLLVRRDFSIPLTLTGCTASLENNSLIYRDLSGNVIGAIPSPWMVDAAGNFGPVTLSYDGVAVTIAPDFNWLKTAAYPVTIDPTTTVQVNAGANDGQSGYSFTTNGQPISVGYINQSEGIYARFTNVAVPQGATVNSAKIQYHADSCYGSPTTRIFFNAADNATNPTSSANYNAKAVTSAYVDWAISGWTNGTWYDSPDIKTVVQEVVNRSGWASGNAMMLLHKNNGSTSGNYARLHSYEFIGNTNAPKLVIEYTAGGTTLNGSATATGSASAQATATLIKPASATATGSATAAATAIRIQPAVATATGTGTAEATAVRAILASATATGSATAEATANIIQTIQASAGATGSATAEATPLLVIRGPPAEATGSAQATASGVVIKLATAVAFGESTEAAAGIVIKPASATADGTGTAQAAALRIVYGAAAASGEASAQAAGVIVKLTGGTADGSTQAQATALRIIPASATATGSATATAGTSTGLPASAEATGAATAAATGTIVKLGAAVAAGTADVTASAIVVRPGSANASGAATAEASALRIASAHADATGAATAQASASQTHLTAATAEGSGEATASGLVVAEIPAYIDPLQAVIKPTRTSATVKPTGHTAAIKPTNTTTTTKPTAYAAVVKSTQTKAVIT